jgi:cytochrome P450
VQISFISGNFDESVFENPYVIDIKRGRIPHLSFGFGPHTCLGNHIAEIEARVFLETLLESGYVWKVSSASKIKYYEDQMVSVPDHFASVRIVRTL